MVGGLAEALVPAPSPAQQRYWTELVQLRVDCDYIRRYRDNLVEATTRVAILRAVVSVSALAGWAVVKAYPAVWAGVIVMVQVAEAIQNVIPFAARTRGCSALLMSLDALFIDCEIEWQDVSAGLLTEHEIHRRLGNLLKLRLEAEKRNLPDGLPRKKRPFHLAEDAAASYFNVRYHTGTGP